MTQAGGVELPAPVCGLVARATDQPYRPTGQECEAVLPIVTPTRDAADGSGRDGLFGPVVAVPEDAPPFDHVLGLAGRDPAWSGG
jgi:hypothetical protein